MPVFLLNIAPPRLSMCVGGRMCSPVSMVTSVCAWLRSFQLPGDACMFWMLHFLHAGETACARFQCAPLN